jgi:hypothetical protein
VRRFVWLLPLITLALPLELASAEVRVIPPMTSEDLNGRKLQVPADMTGSPALWVVAFDREHQAQVDRLLGLATAAVPGLVFWEVPVIEDPGMVVRWFIDNGMRSGIPSEATRAHVVTLYVPNRTAWIKQVGIGSAKETYAVLVAADGMVTAVAPQSKLATREQMRAFLAEGDR